MDFITTSSFSSRDNNIICNISFLNISYTRSPIFILSNYFSCNMTIHRNCNRESFFIYLYSTRRFCYINPDILVLILFYCNSLHNRRSRRSRNSSTTFILIFNFFNLTSIPTIICINIYSIVMSSIHWDFECFIISFTIIFYRNTLMFWLINMNDIRLNSRRFDISDNYRFCEFINSIVVQSTFIVVLISSNRKRNLTAVFSHKWFSIVLSVIMSSNSLMRYLSNINSKHCLSRFCKSFNYSIFR